MPGAEEEGEGGREGDVGLSTDQRKLGGVCMRVKSQNWNTGTQSITRGVYVIQVSIHLRAGREIRKGRVRYIFSDRCDHLGYDVRQGGDCCRLEGGNQDS